MNIQMCISHQDWEEEGNMEFILQKQIAKFLVIWRVNLHAILGIGRNKMCV